MFNLSNIRLAVLLLFFCLFLNSVNCGGKAKSKSCSFDSLEKSVERVFGLFGIKDNQFPSTANEMNNYCKSVKSGIKSGRTFADKCLKVNDRALLKLQLKTIETVNRDYCSKKGSRKNHFIKWSKCGNGAKSETIPCWKKFVGDIGRIASLRDGEGDEVIKKDQFGLMCCKYHQWLDCMRTTWKKHSDSCSNEIVKGFEDLNKKINQDNINLACSKIQEKDRDQICQELEKKLDPIPAIPEDKLPPTALRFVFQILA